MQEDLLLNRLSIKEFRFIFDEPPNLLL